MTTIRSKCAAATVSIAALLATAGAVSAQELKAEVLHWWTSGGESAAVRVFAEQFTKAGGTWIDTAIAGGPAARTAAISRTNGGNPPTAMQFNTGKQFDELVEAGLLADVEAIAAEGKWQGVIPRIFIDAVSRNGKPYAVPVNIHGQNWMWYNRAVFEKAGATEPKTFDELFAALDKLKASGVVPLAFSGQKIWERHLFLTTMVGVGGRELFFDIYSKRSDAAVRSPAFRKVAETYARLKTYTDAGSPGRNWNDATAMLISGKAGVQFMGDWAKGEFAAAKWTAGQEFGCAVIGQHYLMGGDVFAFAKQKDPAAARVQAALAKVLLDPETQIKFALKKGSIPIRTDIDVSTLDACAQKGMALVRDETRQTPDVNLIGTPALIGALDDVITEFWNSPQPNVDAFIAKYAATMKAAL